MKFDLLWHNLSAFLLALVLLMAGAFLIFKAVAPQPNEIVSTPQRVVQDFSQLPQDLGSVQIARWYGNASQQNNVTNEDAKPSALTLEQWASEVVANVQSVISPFETSVTVYPGMRREEIAEVLAIKLNWDEAEKLYFARRDRQCYAKRIDGQFFPGKYDLVTYLTPDEVEEIMQTEFDRRLSGLLANPDPENPIVQNALIIASLLQREAAGTGDERIISGIIWNRLYQGIPLQIDATLQYAKGGPGNWWPIPLPEDKYLDSPFNTYQNDGLPPAPIANPNLAMIEAALNPEPTDCYFYLHSNREFYCSPDYAGHLQNINRYL
jgi:UPF0755 protein